MIELPTFIEPARNGSLLRCGVNTYEFRYMIKTVFEGCNGVATSVSIGFIKLGTMAIITDNKEPVFAFVGVDQSYGSGVPVCVPLNALMDAMEAFDRRIAHLRGVRGGGLRIVGMVGDADIEIPPFIKGEE